MQNPKVHFKELQVGDVAVISRRAESLYAGEVCEITTAPTVARYVDDGGQVKSELICGVRHFDGAQLLAYGTRYAMPVRWLEPVAARAARRPPNRDVEHRCANQEFEAKGPDFLHPFGDPNCPLYHVS